MSGSEEPAERASQYIASFEQALRNFNVAKRDIVVSESDIAKVSDTIHRYLQDARYYLHNNKPTTALASIAYAEGLLDALNFLDLTENGSTS